MRSIVQTYILQFTKAKRNIFALRTPKNLEPDHVFRDEHKN